MFFCLFGQSRTSFLQESQEIVFRADFQGFFITSAEDTWPKMRSAVMNGVDDPSFVKEPVPRT